MYELRDHPRLRGNYVRSVAINHADMGSPPLTRELQNVNFEKKERLGITPAYAGTTSIVMLPSFLRWDHPRLRGNYSMGTTTYTHRAGSPPLTRELLYETDREFAPTGITPAYAGTTAGSRIRLRRWWDHPRLRGNYYT